MNRRECCMNDVKVLNKKGFTLIELLAVIIILSVLMMLAGNSVIDIMMNTRRSAFRTEFLSLLDSAQLKAQTDMLSGKKLNHNGDSVCYCIGKDSSGNNCSTNYMETFNNKGNYVGSVLVKNEGGGNLTFKGWMYSSSYAIEGKDTTLDDDAQTVIDVASATVGESTRQSCAGEK